MNLQEITQLTSESVSRLTSDAYKAAFEDVTTGKAFIEKVNALESAPRQSTRPAGNVRQDAPSPRADFSGDPSWSDLDEQPAVAAPAAVAQPVAVAEPSIELPEKIHRYWPTDRSGKKIGGEQVFKYRTEAELIEKLTAAHSASSARIRELSRNRKLDEIASAGPTAKNFTPSVEVPKTLEELSRELLEQRQQNFLLSVREALNGFQLSVDWSKYRSEENAKSIVLAVERAGDDPTDPASYHRAFHNMEQFLEPVVPAAAAPAPAPVPAVVEQPRTPAVRSTRTVGVPSGLNSDNVFNPEVEAAPTKVAGVRLVMPDGKTQVTTLRDWDRLPSDTQRRILKNQSNARAVDALYQEQQELAAARGR